MKIILGCIGILVVAGAFDLLIAWVLMLCWNALIPALFHGPQVSYGQAVIGMVLLSFIGGFFKSRVEKKS